ncbi:MAG: hypothetical protein KAG97_11470, partial [Victivallales bacterium]|nr:hypothetical protein [Victivallales bacterium]
MKVLDLNGTSHAMGFQQGIQLREQYERMLDDLFVSDLWKDFRPFAVPRSIVMPAIGVAGAIFTKHTVKKYLPAQYNRVKGLAKGLSIRENVAWGLQFLEIIFCEAGKSLVAPLPGGCTQMHALPRATSDGVPLLARNYDFPNLLGPHQIVRRDVPSKRDRLATVTVTQLPIIGAHHGINEAGLVAAANNARLWKGKDMNRSGVPYELLLLEILETCSTVKEAVDFITKFPARGNAGFFGFMDERGDCRLVEFTASRHAVRRPGESGTLAQSNHYHVMKNANLP